MKNKGLWMAALLFSATLCFCETQIVSAETAVSEKITRSGVFIEDVDVSKMNEEQVRTAIEEKFEELKEYRMHLKVGSEFQTITVGDLGLAWKNEEVVEEALNVGNVGNVVARYKIEKDLEREPIVLNLAYDIEEETAKQTVQEKCVPFDRDPQNAQITRTDGEFVITSGKQGQKVNVDQSVELIKNYLCNEWRTGDSTIEISILTEEPKVTEEELGKIQSVLGKGSTDYSSSSSQRAKNVKNGTSKLNGKIIFPGETFSVTEAVIPFDAENGYEKAPSYENGSVVDTYGGGICQVSTTLYLAVLRAELEVVERHNHSMIVTYVKPSMDAAIAEGVKDFQFKNNTNAPIYVEGYADGGEIGFRIYGQEYRSEDREVSYESETTSTTEPEVKLVASEEAIGKVTQTQKAHTGYTAKLWKTVTENGESKKEQINSSTYAASPNIYKVGVATSDESAKNKMYAAIATNSLDKVYEAISSIQSAAATPEEPKEDTPTPTEPTPTDPTPTDPAPTDQAQTDSTQTESTTQNQTPTE